MLLYRKFSGLGLALALLLLSAGAGWAADDPPLTRTNQSRAQNEKKRYSKRKVRKVHRKREKKQLDATTTEPTTTSNNQSTHEEKVKKTQDKQNEVPLKVEEATEEPRLINDQQPTAEKKVRKTHRKRKKVHLDVDAAIGVLGGYSNGVNVHSAQTAVILANAFLKPKLRLWDFSLESRLRLDHRQTLGASLSEMLPSGFLALSYQPSRRFKITAEGGLSGAWRPDWPDLYQPRADQTLTPTDRYSHFDRAMGIGLSAVPFRHNHVRLNYQYWIADYAQDPNFDGINNPNHIAPFDNEQHNLNFSWRYIEKPWSAGIGLDFFHRQYFFVFARDAGTGKTHAPPGGLPPNPLQVLRKFEPYFKGKVSLWEDVLRIELGYGVEIQEDEFQGYYSYLGHHPFLGITILVAEGQSLSATADVYIRTYGSGSYAAGPDHPPLTYGDRRVDRRCYATLEGQFNLWQGLFLIATAQVRIRRTNFPDYEPGIFPASQSYDITWDFNEVLAAGGLQYRF